MIDNEDHHIKVTFHLLTHFFRRTLHGMRGHAMGQTMLHHEARNAQSLCIK